MTDLQESEGTSPYQFTLIDNTAGLWALRHDWCKLFAEAHNHNFFQRPEWLLAWWESFSRPDDQLAAIWVERSGKPCALAPFFIRSEAYYGVKRRILRFIGEGNSDRSDILEKINDTELYTPLFSFLRSKLQWDVASFRELPEASGLLTWSAGRRRVFIEKDSDCPFISFAPGMSVEAYLANLAKKVRQDFKKMVTRIEKTGKHRSRFQVLRKNDLPLLKKIREIELQSAKATRALNLVFSPDENEQFQRLLLERLDTEVQVLVTTLEIDEEIIAYLYGFIDDDVYHAYNTAYLPDFAFFSPGKFLLHETINHCIVEQMREFDFLRGNSHLKRKWSTAVRLQYHLTVMEPSLFNQLHALLIFSVRPRMKKLHVRFRHIISNLQAR